MKVNLIITATRSYGSNYTVWFEKEIEMPTVFVGMEIWHKTDACGVEIKAVTFDIETGKLTAEVITENEDEEEFERDYSNWLEAGFTAHIYRKMNSERNQSR